MRYHLFVYATYLLSKKDVNDKEECKKYFVENIVARDPKKLLQNFYCTKS